MRDVLAMAAQVGFVVFAGIIAVQVASRFAAPEAVSAPHLDPSADSIWTTEPQKVDRRGQDYERLPTPPDPFPFKFRADKRWKPLASNRFSFNGDTYRITGLEAVERNRICIDAQGRRFACGLNAFKALDNVVRGKFLECRILAEEESDKTVECEIAGESLPRILGKVPGLPPVQ